MDRYDALIEHLKTGRRHGLDSVANRLNSLVNDIESYAESMKAAVQDALPSDADEVFPMAEFEAGLTEIRDAAADAPGPFAGISLDNLRTLDRAQSQSELLRSLLPVLCEHVGRAVVLVIREGVVTAWSGEGFEDSESIRAWNGGIAASPNFSGLANSRKPCLIDPSRDPLLSEWMAGQDVPGEGVLLPISLRGKLMGIIYADHAGDQPWNLESAQALTAVACLLIDTLPHRGEGPSPILTEIAAAATDDLGPAVASEPVMVSAAPEPPAEPEVVETVEPVEVAEPVEPETSFEPPQPEEAAAPEPQPVVEAAEPDAVEVEDYDFEPEPVVEDFDPSATMRVEVADDLQGQSFEPEPAVDVSTPAPEPEAPSAVPPSVEDMEAPPPVRPIEPPAEEPAPGAEGALSADDEARHEEARRFARLLVSEIKLYNEDEVDRGRAEKDLGIRLKDDIERSREMFEKRIPADIRTGNDYFQEELIRILADGDADALGV